MEIEKLYELFKKHPRVITDSRQVASGCLFFALKGERFNGNAFAQKALASGAAFAVIDEVVPFGNDKAESGRCILVPEVLETLQQLALHHRRQFDIPVLAITGSNGKTTTKELASAVLASHYRTHFTQGNLNNHIGVPLTLLAMPPETEVAVVEMGANHPGEIADLCRIAEPTHGLITNVGKAHLEGFGSFEGVMQAKSELYRHLARHKGVAFVNLDEPHLAELAAENHRVIFYQQSDDPQPSHPPGEVKLLAEQPFVEAAFLSEKGGLVSVKSHLVGRHNFQNLMTAIIAGKYFKVPAEKIKAAVEAYVPASNRSQMVAVGSNIFLLDAYNANPPSMRNALDFFKKMDAPHKVAVLGAMKELGVFSEEEHEGVAEFAASCGLEQVALVGGEFRRAALRTGALFFENTEELKAWFERQDFTRTHFLVKGSRSVGLEKLLAVAAG